MTNYFKENETNDLQMLYEFNYNEKLFDSIKPAKEKCQYDCICTHKNRTFAVELKHRLINLEHYKTIMIEDYKFASMMLEWTINKREPLYINFLADGNVLIFNLAKLKTMPKQRITNINSKGYDKMQCQERRYLLDINDAIIYKQPLKECKTKDYS